jgi:hypothetical protein
MLLRNPSFGTAIRVGHPFVRQEQPEPDRHRDLALRQGERDQDLAVRLLAQDAAVLPGHPNRALALLRTRGVVDHQYRIRTADQRLRFLDQDPPQRCVIPGRAGDEVLQLIVTTQPEASRKRLEAFAPVRAEQALQVQGGPAPPRLAAQHLEERRQPELQGRLDPRCFGFHHATSPRRLRPAKRWCFSSPIKLPR